ncbi:hypothetical protein MTO96_028733 [Rhipicephalus appendiculatus]
MFEALPNPPLTADTVAASTQECTVLKEVYAAIQEGKVQKLKDNLRPQARGVLGCNHHHNLKRKKKLAHRLQQPTTVLFETSFDQNGFKRDFDDESANVGRRNVAQGTGGVFSVLCITCCLLLGLVLIVGILAITNTAKKSDVDDDATEDLRIHKTGGGGGGGRVGVPPAAVGGGSTSSDATQSALRPTGSVVTPAPTPSTPPDNLNVHDTSNANDAIKNYNYA